ncbi:MAG: methyltransferase domain-containing protein [Polynucleobacter sp.]|jgi:SAM-dependent methyltransferase|nr:methyltransferase domain-containing protein [Polynucleobacter sp.]
MITSPSNSSPSPNNQSWFDWLESPPGQYILNSEQALFNSAVVDVFGYNAVQIGLPQMNTLQENRIPLRLLMVNRDDLPHIKSPVEYVIEGIADELPFANNSIDLIVLPHVLEFADDPHQILREIDRVLIPEGRIIISGFNPASLWGARQYLSRVIGKPYLPREGQFLSLIQVKDWLQLLDYSLDRGHFACYRLPLRSERGMQRMAFLEKMGNRWWPIFGSIFLISAVKRQPGIRLVGRIPKQRLSNLGLNPAANPAVNPSTSLPVSSKMGD